VRALIRATHRRGRLAVAHVTEQSYGREAVEDGIDGLVHSPPPAASRWSPIPTSRPT
jgi:hypothetical protein